MGQSQSSDQKMTAEQVRTWLRDWVVRTTGLPAEEVSDDKAMETFGLSSRDVVVLSGELENLLDITLDATIAYEYPTIRGLAQRLIDGEPERSNVKRELNYTPIGSAPGNHDIAVVGLAARFPGAGNAEEMWKLLVEGRDGIGELPIGRWSEYAGDEVMSRKMEEYSTVGGYLPDIASFDAEFFGLSPLEAANMDPQQRILLELTWESLESARIAPNSLRGEAVGVFIGSSNNDYGMMIAADPAEAHPYALTGTSSAIVANRINYAFDFRGPSINVDTACSSSLVAVHQAVRALRSGDADHAIAGGVNILASPFVTTAFAELGVISPTGKIHAFSDDADGFVRSDGAGVVVLKRVSDAIADGDEILAVIKGSAVNSDGHSNGLTAPNPDAQIDVLQRAYMDARVDPTTVDYVEAHGTGTILGDPIEATALGAVLGQGRDSATPTLLGSAKTNFGHTESAAGIAGIIKVVLAMKNKTLPPSVNYAGPNRYIDFDAERIEVVEDPREWPQYSGRALAGVSGFGFGGTNAHVVISEFNPEDYTADLEGHRPQAAQLADVMVALPVSGHLPSRRRQAAADLATFLEGRRDEDLTPVARALARRNHGRSRAVVLASSIEEAVKRLRQVAEGKVSVGISTADAPAANGPVFVYSGFGSQHRKMIKDLCSLSPQFRERIEELDEMVKFESGWSIMDIVLDDEQTYDTETAQVTITAIQIALTDLLAGFGIRPAAVMGMSMGEIAAAYAAGGLSDRDTMLIASHRSRLMGEGEKSLPEDQLGAMAVVELSTEALEEFNAGHAELPDIEPAVYAAPGMTTVGGDRKAVIALVEELEKEGKFARLLNVKGAGHTSAVEPLLGELAAEIAGIEPQPLQIPLFSSVDQGVTYPVGSVVHDADYMLRCTRNSVYFQDATEAAFAAGYNTLVEISPNPVALMGMMNTAFTVGKPDAQLLFTLKRKVSEAESLRDLMAKMYVAGAPVDFGQLYGEGEIIDPPSITWKHQRFWTSARPSSGASADLPGTRVTLPNNNVAFTTVAELAPSAIAIMETAADAVLPGSSLVAVDERDMLPPSGEITTVVARNLGGLGLSVYKVTGGTTTLVAEGFAAAPGFGVTSEPIESELPEPPAQLSDLPLDFEAVRWDPATETVEERMRAIVSEAMGYDVDDLPRELPLIDLGLDSLMGMRIKNRIENDFQIPPLQVQVLRDASVADAVTLVEELVAGRTNGDSDSATTVESANTVLTDGPIGAVTSTDIAGEVASDAATEVSEAPAALADPAGALGVSAQVTAAPTTSDAAPKAGATGVGVAPRDASERMVFGTWAGLTGKAAAGITSELPEIDVDTATRIAERLTDRSGVEITTEQVLAAETLEPLSDMVREGLETEVEGNIRVLRAREEGSTKPAVFMFHPAGGSSVVYQPLMRRLPADVPVYGVERLEGSLEERSSQYIEDIVKYSDGLPVVLGGWSFGGALAFEVAHKLQNTDVEVATIALLDTVRPSEPIPDTPEETRARWERYSNFARNTYGLEFDVPYELLDMAGEDGLLNMLGEFLSTTDASEHGLSAGVLEHQRASFVDNRILDKLDFSRWAEVDVPVLLFRAERMHDGAIELEPNYAHIDPDGGWSVIVEDLEVIQLSGDHLAIVDEPVIGKVGAHMSRRIEEISRKKN